MAKLSLAVRREQQYFSLRSFGKLLHFLFVFGQQLHVLTSLVLQPAKTDLGESAELSCFRQAASFLEQSGGTLDHSLIGLAFIGLNKFQGDQTSTHCALCFERWFLRLVSQRFVLLERIQLFSTCHEDRCSRHSSILAIGIWIACFGDLHVYVSGFLLFAESLKTARFKIARRKCHRGLLRLAGRTMKKRERR